MREVKPYKLEELIDARGVNHFRRFLEDISSSIDKARILARLNRVSRGNLGEYQDLKNGIYELKFRSKGPGYRVYFGKQGSQIIILIGGGVKRGQQKDIEFAKALWKAYQASKKE